MTISNSFDTFIYLDSFHLRKMFASNNENSIENSTKPIENMQAVHISDNNRQANGLEREKTSMYNAPLETTK